MKNDVLTESDRDPIVIVPYDPQWPVQFRSLALPLRAALGERALRLDHIGSTAVPGLAAKPVIDIQISVTDFVPESDLIGPLEALGYRWRADNPDRTKRYLREPIGAPRVHIHVRRLGSWSQQFALLYRDYMRANPDEHAPYARLKTELAERFRHQRDAYTDGKDAYLWQIMYRADRWSQHTGWQPPPSDI